MSRQIFLLISFLVTSIAYLLVGCGSSDTCIKSAEYIDSLKYSKDFLIYRPSLKDLYKLPSESIERRLIKIINPYQNYKYFYKGQIHAHTNRSSDGTLSAKQVLEKYKNLDYDFVIITDHDKRDGPAIYCFNLWDCGTDNEDLPCSDIFEVPDVPNILHIPGRESGKGTRTHFLELGVNYDSTSIFGLPLTTCGPLGDFDLVNRTAWIEKIGGVAVAPHPLAEGHTWNQYELYTIPWLRGIEIEYNQQDLWDELLIADRMRWGFSSDDSHSESDMNKGWVVVNAQFSSPPVWQDILRSLRIGNFYSVETPGDYCNTKPVPKIEKISALGQEITVTFKNAREVRYKTSDGIVREQLLFDEDSEQPQVSHYFVRGTERYIRIELENSDGVIAFSQPLFIYGTSSEDCLSFNYQNARVVNVGWSFLPNWAICDVNHRILEFGMYKDLADKALEIIKYYELNKDCFVSRPNPPMQYYLSNWEAPTGNYPSEDCIDFNPANLSIELITNTSVNPPIKSWKIMDGENSILDIGDSEIIARRSLEIINRHGFTKVCYVGRNILYPFMTYFRR